MTSKIFTLLAVCGGVMCGVYAQFTCKINVPAGALGESRTAVVTYGNTGSEDIPAPFVRIEAGTDAYVRFAATDAWSKSVEFFATSEQVQGYSLIAGETVKLPVYVCTDVEDAQLTLSWLESSKDEFPWSSIGSSLKPSYVSDEAWTFALTTLKSRLGDTWNSYLDQLCLDAFDLAKAGSNVRRVDRLLQVEVNAALGVDAAVPVLASVTDAARPARGMGLSFTRSYSSAMHGRFSSGILGYGWTDNLSAYAELTDDNTLVFRIPGGGSYAFTKVTGTWQPEDARDKTVLTEYPSDYTLEYQNGTVQTFAKSNMRTESITDASGNALSFTWSGTKLHAIEHTDGQTLTFEYSDELLSSVADDCGRTTRYTYSNSLLTKVTASDGLETSYEYRPADGTAAARALSRIVYPDGTTREFSYDTSSGLVTAISVNGGKEKTTISRNGLNVTLTGPDGAATTVATGVHGEVLKTTDALGGVSTKGYTDDGLLKSVVSPSGLTGSISHDALGRVSKSVSAAGTATAFTYEETFGNLKSVTDARNNAVTYGYDELGRGTSVMFADGSASTLEYNGFGDVVKSTNRRGQSITYEYDSQGRLTKKTWSNGRTFAYAYDEEGNMVAASDSETGQVSMYYIVGGRLNCIFYPNGRAIFYKYDSETGRLVLRKHGKATVTGRPESPNPEYDIWQEEFKLEYDEDSAEVFAYDASGRLASVSDGNGKVYLKNTYDETTGRLAKQENGNGTSVSYLYDKLGRVVSIEHRGADGKIAEAFQYCYDADGRCIRAASLLGEERYGYDKDGQLTAVEYPDGANESFAYDAVGNRTSRTGGSPVQETYKVNNLNQYTEIVNAQAARSTMSYDKDGNMTSMTDATGTTTYTYDTLNRLVAVENKAANIHWSCKYDVFGNRVSVTHNGVTTERMYLQGSLPSVAAEYVNGELKERHIVVGAVRIADISRTGGSPVQNEETRYYHADLIGSTRLVTDGNGAVISRRAYKAFGETRIAGGSQSSATASVGYVGTLGVETDPTGLLFMRNRYYSPTLGRFIQMDPIGLKGEDENWYRYCGNNPISSNDIMGLWTWGDTFTVTKIIAGGVAMIAGGPWAIAIGLSILAADTALYAEGELMDVDTGISQSTLVLDMVGLGLSAGSEGMLNAGFDKTAKVLGWGSNMTTAGTSGFDAGKLGFDIFGYKGGHVNTDLITDVNNMIAEQIHSEYEYTINIDGSGGSGGSGGDSPGNPDNPGGGGSSGGEPGGGDNPDNPGGGSGSGSIMNQDDWLRVACHQYDSADPFNATFSLGADIEINLSKPGYLQIGDSKVYYTESEIKASFSGTLNGNGHTITVTGGNSADYLFLVPKGARFENVTFVGKGVRTASNCTFVNCASKTYPLADSATSCTFTGCHSTGVNINLPDGFQVGTLAGNANSCSFINCSAEGSLTGENNTGGLVGESNGCLFNNCVAKVAVTGYDNVGGMVGWSENDEFSGLTAQGDVTGTGDGQVGGFVGISKDSKFANCQASGRVRGEAEVGGFAGFLTDGSIVSHCSTSGEIVPCGSSPSGIGGFAGTISDGCEISDCLASGNVSDGGVGTIGGFVGSCSGNTENPNATKIQRCCSRGSVVGGTNIGGFAGSLEYCVVSDCCSSGSTTATGQTVSAGGYTTTSANAGGFAAVASPSTGGGTLRHCYASGQVTVPSAAGITDVITSGGLTPFNIPAEYIAYLSADQLQSMLEPSDCCYWNKNTTGQNYSGTGTGLTTGQAQNQSSFSGWDFSGVWIMGSNGPELRNVGATSVSANVKVAAKFKAKVVNNANAGSDLPKNLRKKVTTDSVTAAGHRLYCYDRYVVAKGSAYAFELSAGDGAAISVSGLPSGFLYSNGEIYGFASAIGETTVTISSGTTTRSVPFVVVEAPGDLAPYVSSLVCFDADGGSSDTGFKVIPNGTTIGDIPVPTRTGYTFDGWFTAADGGSRVSSDTVVTGSVTYYAHWTSNGGGSGNGGSADGGGSGNGGSYGGGGSDGGGGSGNGGSYGGGGSGTTQPNDPAAYILYNAVDGVVPALASVYDGYLYRNGSLAGTIQVKVGKPNTKTGLATVKATVVGTDGNKKTLRAADRGKVKLASNGPSTVSLVGGDTCVVTLGAKGMGGTYGNYEIDGGLNVFTSKDAADKAVAAGVLGKWQGAVNVAWRLAGDGSPYHTLSVTIAAKGKAKVVGTLADGTKVSAKGQLVVGEEWCCVPVVYAKRGVNLRFAVWLPMNVLAARSTRAVGLPDAIVGKPGTLKDGATFRLGASLGDAKYSAYLPDGLPVTGGARWTLPRAGKVVYAKGTTTVDEAKLGENPSALKLTYKAKDGWHRHGPEVRRRCGEGGVGLLL